MGEKSPKDRKSRSPKNKSEVGMPNAEADKKSNVVSPKSEEESHSALNMPQSAIKELPTENQQPQTEPMEVHHHPNLHHEKKPWKEYILEGLMIFLAVTMGFFAESLREHINEHDRANDFAISLYADLKADTAE